MMKHLLVLIICCLAHLPAWTQETWTFFWQGIYRNCLVDFPPSRTGQAGLPVLFALHGYGATATSLRNYAQLQTLGDSVGFVTVYPNAYDHRWNSGIGDDPDYPTPNVDDVGFISRIIDSLISRYAIDSLRVYTCGHSNGGFMSIRLAAQLSNRIAAATSVSGVLTNSTAASFSAIRPVPLMMVHGTSDQVVPYDGGVQGWYSVGETIGFWIVQNDCSLPSDTTDFPDSDPNDQSTVVKYSYRSPTNSSKVELLKVIGGGHTWPGARPSPQFGATNNDINANDEIWNFFKQFSITLAGVPENRNDPRWFVLSQNYPNPFNPTTSIQFTIVNRRLTILKVYDTLGREVETLVNELKEPGKYTVTIDATGLASGVYFLRMQSGDFVQTRKLVVLR
jgi:polyhydroxybutyrate depolymerase